eukprot:13194619-Alexandrium_andersonii.AAC.1
MAPPGQQEVRRGQAHAAQQCSQVRRWHRGVLGSACVRLVLRQPGQARDCAAAHGPVALVPREGGGGNLELRSGPVGHLEAVWAQGPG